MSPLKTRVTSKDEMPRAIYPIDPIDLDLNGLARWHLCSNAYSTPICRDDADSTTMRRKHIGKGGKADKRR